jgi:hypothetical protein
VECPSRVPFQPCLHLCPKKKRPLLWSEMQGRGKVTALIGNAKTWKWADFREPGANPPGSGRPQTPLFTPKCASNSRLNPVLTGFDASRAALAPKPPHQPKAARIDHFPRSTANFIQRALEPTPTPAMPLFHCPIRQSPPSSGLIRRHFGIVCHSTPCADPFWY